MLSDACLFIQGAAAGGQGDEGISLSVREEKDAGHSAEKEEQEEELQLFFFPSHNEIQSTSCN